MVLNKDKPTDRLIQMLHSIAYSSEESDSLQDVLALYAKELGDVDISIAWFGAAHKPELFASTLADEDHYLSLQEELVRICKEVPDTKPATIDALDLSGRIARFPEVKDITVVNLHSSRDSYGLLVIDWYALPIRLPKFQEAYQELFTVLVRSMVLMRNSRISLKLDEISQLFGVEQFMDDLSRISEEIPIGRRKNMTLGMFRISGLQQLILMDNYENTVTAISDEIRQRASNSYRLSTSVFACIIKEHYIDATPVLKDISFAIRRLGGIECTTAFAMMDGDVQEIARGCEMCLRQQKKGEIVFFRKVQQDQEFFPGYEKESERVAAKEPSPGGHKQSESEKTLEHGGALGGDLEDAMESLFSDFFD